MKLTKKPEEDDEFATVWLITYSDMVTLLLAFFLLIYAFSVFKDEERNGRLAYVASPSGQSEAVFLETESTDRTVAFEAPDHDFPQRIVYERMSPRSILAWIEGDIDGVSRVVEFPMTAVRCP